MVVGTSTAGKADLAPPTHKENKNTEANKSCELQSLKHQQKTLPLIM
jgi:hypothetical protein